MVEEAQNYGEELRERVRKHTGQIVVNGKVIIKPDLMEKAMSL